jgi:hypothetical protein
LDGECATGAAFWVAINPRATSRHSCLFQEITL